MSESPDAPSDEPGKGKWSELPRTAKPLKPHPSDGKPSEYGLPVGMGEHPLRAFYREARESEEADAEARRRGDAR